MAKSQRRTVHHAVKSDVRFSDLAREADPSAMQVAEDALLARGQKMREAAGGLHARNFTIELEPLWKPRDQWKMVQTSVYPATKKTRKGYEPKLGRMEAKLSVANGSARVSRTYEIKADPDEAKRQAVATAWAIANSIKVLPLETSEADLAKVVDQHVKAGKKNAQNPELF